MDFFFSFVPCYHPLMSSKQTDQYSDAEAERRATNALRRALNTPYRPQRDMVGKTGQVSKAKPKRKPTKKTNPK